MLVLLHAGLPGPAGGVEGKCIPTAEDAEGPFYKPGAPERLSTGSGLTVSGEVLSWPGWWRPTADGKLYWKSDTSSDEIDGHYMAFYAYYEYIARHDPAEQDLCVKQVRAVTDYIVDHNYQLIDWTGKRTRWGFWNPESLNDDPEHYLENGLNSLQMLSFLKVAHYITGDAKYDQHYRKLIHEHGYLNNTLLSKKVFPVENNHSDNQLGFVAWYPILQLERDPAIRAALLHGGRRHYEIVKAEIPARS